MFSDRSTNFLEVKDQHLLDCVIDYTVVNNDYVMPAARQYATHKL